MVVVVVLIDVAAVVGRGCETDGCCDTKCGGFFDKGGILEMLKIKWKMKTAENKDTEGNHDVDNMMVMSLLVEIDEEVHETTKDKNTSFSW